MVSLSLSSLSPETRGLIAPLATVAANGRFYLAGSAALAVYLEHRPVRDLDVMSSRDRLTGPSRRDLLARLQSLCPGLRVETARDGYLFVRAASGPAMRFYSYPYPLIDPPQGIRGLALASITDLGLMKLAAIISRGTRRDFVDLYLLTRQLPLADLLARSAEKFGHVLDFPLQALKALADLSLTHGEPMPRLHGPLGWPEIEVWLRAEVATLGRAHLGLAPGGSDPAAG